MARFRGELKELPSSCGGSLAVSLTVSKSESNSGSTRVKVETDPSNGCGPFTREAARLTKVGVVSLVKEQLVADSLHDDVPGVD